MSLTEAWERLTGAEGLAAGGSFAGASEGSRYSVTASTGDLLEGEVLINMPPKTLSITIRALMMRCSREPSRRWAGRLTFTSLWRRTEWRLKQTRSFASVGLDCFSGSPRLPDSQTYVINLRRSLNQ